MLLKGSDPNKDQSYFLHKLNQEQISNALFPIGKLKKKHVRTVANKYRFANFSKKDSFIYLKFHFCSSLCLHKSNYIYGLLLNVHNGLLMIKDQ